MLCNNATKSALELEYHITSISNGTNALQEPILTTGSPPVPILLQQEREPQEVVDLEFGLLAAVGKERAEGPLGPDRVVGQQEPPAQIIAVA